MLSPMRRGLSGGAGALPRSVARSWRTATRRSQRSVLGLMLLGVGLCVLVSLVCYSVLPVGAYFLWLIGGMLLLRFGPLAVLTAATVAGGLGTAMYDGVAHDALTTSRVANSIALVAGGLLVLWHARGQRTGLPTHLGEEMLADLRERLLQQGRVPALPAPWRVETSMLAAHDVAYAGDFMTVSLDPETGLLDVVLVDVVGQGVAAGVDALQFAGALAGLIGALPPHAVMEAANDFLLRQGRDEAFATAASLRLDLATGRYEIRSAGHPPALRFDPATDTWEVDLARGLALGVHRHPELAVSEGVLPPGGALLFYTDGVVETRGSDIDAGIAWLREVARLAVAPGFEGAPGRIVRQVPRGDDDRAVLLLSR